MACSEHSTWRRGMAGSVAFYLEAWHGLLHNHLWITTIKGREQTSGLLTIHQKDLARMEGEGQI